MDSSPSPAFPPDLQVLVDLFYSSFDSVGRFTELVAADMPQPFRRLLAHDEHMTVTVEAFFGGPVTVEVLAVHRTPTHYSRKIVLRRSSDRRAVLFGLVRLNLSFLDPTVRSEIESERIPLGRVLIEHNVMRNVRLLSLWRIEPSSELREIFELGEADPVAHASSGESTCYGRTALIYCNGVPAVELLEIVTPREASLPKVVSSP